MPTLLCRPPTHHERALQDSVAGGAGPISGHPASLGIRDERGGAMNRAARAPMKLLEGVHADTALPATDPS
jgi:hypothetical protein